MASFGGNNTQKVTTTSELSPQQQALIDPVIPIAQQYLQNPPQLPDYSQVAPLDPQQIAAQNSLLGAVAPQQATAGAANATNQFLLDPAILDPSSNRYLQATIDAAVRPISQNLMETVLPGLRGEAVTNGQFGSSRQGIAEGLASGRASQAIGDTSAKIASAGYGQGLDALTKGLALTPQTLAALTIPGQTQAAVGDQNRALSQAQLSEKAYKDMYAQIAPFLAAKEVAALGAGLPGGSTTSTAPGPSTNPLSAITGIGSILASLFGGGAGLSAGAAGLTGAGLF